MSLNGIDTASYQAGLDPAKVPMDFNIVKATQGTSYTNPDFKRMANATLSAGHLLGVYHYAAGQDPAREADFFLKTSADYIGKAILCLDWEGEQNTKFGKQDVSWCKTFCDRVKEKTGVRCFIYMSKSVCRAHDWSSVAKTYPLWCAQYASMKSTGYQSSPWTDANGFGAWAKPTIYQYSSAGSLTGWGARLDLDIAYLTKTEWNGYAKGTAQKSAEIKFPDRTDTDLAVEILFGAHGSGDKRKDALGMRYDGAQGEVNRLLQSNTQLLIATQAYLKKFGHDKLI